MTEGPLLESALPIKILMICGAWPPEPCGVGDNTASLSTALAAENFEIIRFKPKTRLFDFGALLAEIKKLRPDIVHIQYPSEGYERSLIPLLLPIVLRQPCVITIHEYGIYRFRRLRFFPFTFAKALIFTNEFEFKRFKAEIHLTPSNTSIVPIGSAIPIGSGAVRRVPGSVCYFGLIVPGKGIEDFLQLARLLSGHPFSFSFIGAVQYHRKAYAEDIVRELESLGVAVHLQKSAEDVAQLLSASTYAYLPFIDGASEKRSSLLAVLVNGVRVLTPHGPTTSEALRQATLDAQSPEAAASLLIALENAGQTVPSAPGADPHQAIRERFSWSGIVRSHRKIYAALLSAGH